MLVFVRDVLHSITSDTAHQMTATILASALDRPDQTAMVTPVFATNPTDVPIGMLAIPVATSLSFESKIDNLQ